MTYIVKKAFRPTGTGSRLTVVGEDFEAATASQAKLFKALGRIVEKPADTKPAEPVRSAYKTSAKTAAKTAGKTAAKSTYFTRQMTAAKTDDEDAPTVPAALDSGSDDA